MKRSIFYKIFLISMCVLITYNFVDNYLISERYFKANGTIVNVCHGNHSDPTYHFSYNYKIGDIEKVDSTKFGSAFDNTYQIGEKVEILYKEDFTTLNTFRELYGPNLTLLILLIGFHFVSGWFMEGFSGEYKKQLAEKNKAST